MKERPIIFSAPMVRAILDGTKTQTRRVLKPQPPANAHQVETWHHPDSRPRYFTWTTAGEISDAWEPLACPYGQPGDRLWVRETCRAEELTDGLDGVRYLADDGFVSIQPNNDGINRWLEMRDYGKRSSPVARVKTVPAIHMPRWASRITLEVTGVRVERLQDISNEDALAEGVNIHPDHHSKPPTSIYSPVQAYRDLWEAINGHGSWDANPWVWVAEFKRLAGGET